VNRRLDIWGGAIEPPVYVALGLGQQPSKPFWDDIA
jgi:hypothetical protein